LSYGADIERMCGMKAIETEYKGYKFRSRLEARWAVFFDAIGIKWEYEPEGYQFEDGTMYLPDFYFPSLDYYGEVKGRNDQLQDDIVKAERLVRSSKKTLILFSQIPYSEESKGLYFFPEIYYTSLISEKHINYGYMNFEVIEPEVLVTEHLAMERKRWRNGTWRSKNNDNNDALWKAIQPVCGEELDKDEFKYRDAVNFSIIQTAILKARQARFEHGEHPTKE